MFILITPVVGVFIYIIIPFRKNNPSFFSVGVFTILSIVFMIMLQYNVIDFTITWYAIQSVVLFITICLFMVCALPTMPFYYNLGSSTKIIKSYKELSFRNLCLFLLCFYLIAGICYGAFSYYHLDAILLNNNITLNMAPPQNAISSSETTMKNALVQYTLGAFNTVLSCFHNNISYYYTTIKHFMVDIPMATLNECFGTFSCSIETYISCISIIGWATFFIACRLFGRSIRNYFTQSKVGLAFHKRFGTTFLPNYNFSAFKGIIDIFIVCFFIIIVLCAFFLHFNPIDEHLAESCNDFHADLKGWYGTTIKLDFGFYLLSAWFAQGLVKVVLLWFLGFYRSFSLASEMSAGNIVKLIVLTISSFCFRACAMFINKTVIVGNEHGISISELFAAYNTVVDVLIVSIFFLMYMSIILQALSCLFNISFFSNGKNSNTAKYTLEIASVTLKVMISFCVYCIVIAVVFLSGHNLVQFPEIITAYMSVVRG